MPLSPPIDEADAAQIRAALDHVPGLVDRYHALMAIGPATGSAAEMELTFPFGNLSWVFASQSLAAACDHLQAWWHLFAAGVLPHNAQAALVRGALEGIVTCRWLVDPKGDRAERLRRGAAIQLRDLRDRANFEVATGGDKAEPEGGWRPASVRVEEQLAEMSDLGIAVTKMPGVTKLFDEFALTSGKPGGHLYQLLSGLAHNREWAVLAGDLQPEPVTDNRQTRGVVVSSNKTVVIATTIFAVRAFDRALLEMAGYAGR